MFSKKVLRWILISQFTITVPDIKDQLLTDAKNAYNTRTGQSVTLNNYLKELIRRGVASELTTQQHGIAVGTITANNTQCTAENAASQAAVEAYLATQLGGW